MNNKKPQNNYQNNEEYSSEKNIKPYFIESDDGLITYVKPGWFSIQYPNYWYFSEENGDIGYEIIMLFRKDPQKALPHDPDSAKVSLSIQYKKGNNIEEIIENYAKKNNIIYSNIEMLKIDNKNTIRIYFKHWEETVEVFIDYTIDKFVIITGFYVNKEKTNFLNEIKSIQESFKSLIEIQ